MNVSFFFHCPHSNRAGSRAKALTGSSPHLYRNTSYCETLPSAGVKAEQWQHRVIVMSISFYFSAQWSERDCKKALEMSILSALSMAKKSKRTEKKREVSSERSDRTRTDKTKGTEEKERKKTWESVCAPAVWNELGDRLKHAFGQSEKIAHYQDTLLQTSASCSLCPFVFLFHCSFVSMSSSFLRNYHDTQQYVVQMDKHCSSLLCVILVHLVLYVCVEEMCASSYLSVSNLFV